MSTHNPTHSRAKRVDKGVHARLRRAMDARKRAYAGNPEPKTGSPQRGPRDASVAGRPSRGRTESKRRAEQELAEQRRLAPVLREAHARLRLWRTCDDKTCRRTQSCGGEVDQCGARVAPQGWAWLHQVIKAMREGKSQSAAVEAANLAALGYRDRFILRWRDCPVWEPIEFFVRNDGTWIRTDMAPTQPDIDPQFIELAASPWLPTWVHADTKT